MAASDPDVYANEWDAKNLILSGPTASYVIPEPLFVISGPHESYDNGTYRLKNLTELAAEIVSAYVSKNSVSNADLQTLIANVHRALQAIQTGETVSLDKPEQKPAVPIKKSLTPDYLVSLEDGARYKSLKRHLATKYGLTPQAYREKWGLPNNYPMVAPSYAAA